MVPYLLLLFIVLGIGVAGGYWIGRDVESRKADEYFAALLSATERKYPPLYDTRDIDGRPE